jgi:hypothetical protein
VDLFASFRSSINFDNHQKLPEMKKTFEALLPLFGTILMCLGGCVTAPKPTNVDLSPVSASVASIDHSLDQAISAKTLFRAKPALLEAKKEIVVAQQKISDAQVQVKQVQDQRDWWKNDDQKKDAKVSSLENRVSHLEHLLFLCSALISIVAGGIGWSLFKNIPYGAWVTGGIIITTFTSAWFALGHLL